MSGVHGLRTPVGPQLLIMSHTDQVALKVVRGISKDGDEEPAAAEIVPPEDRFLQQDDEGFWKLGPLPDVGTVLRVDLANAMHIYVTQKWSECAELKQFAL